MKYIDFLTPDKEKQNFITETVNSLEKELNLIIRINNLVGDTVYIKVKRKKRRFFGNNDSIILKKIKEAFASTDKKIDILLVDK